MAFDIVEAKPWHCGRLARALRYEHQVRFSASGLDIHRELRRSFDASSWRRSAFQDGRLIGMGGIVGSEIEAGGYIWMALTQEALKQPIAVVRTMRRMLDEIMEVRRELACIVLPEDTAALRLAVFMGFHCVHDGPGRPAKSKLGRRDLMRYIERNGELRMPFGKSSCVPLGLHG